MTFASNLFLIVLLPPFSNLQIIDCYWDRHVEVARHSSEQQAVEEDEAETEVWPLLAAVKCRKPAVAEALIARLGVRSRRDAHGRSELHALAESQRGPFPPLPVQ